LEPKDPICSTFSLRASRTWIHDWAIESFHIVFLRSERRSTPCVCRSDADEAFPVVPFRRSNTPANKVMVERLILGMGLGEGRFIRDGSRGALGFCAWGPDLGWGAVETTYGVRRNVRFRSTPQWPFPPGSSFKLQDLRTTVMDLHTVCWTRFCRTGLRRQVPGVLDVTSSVRLRATDSMLDAFNGEIPEAEGGDALKLVVARRSITCRFQRASGLRRALDRPTVGGWSLGLIPCINEPNSNFHPFRIWE